MRRRLTAILVALAIVLPPPAAAASVADERELGRRFYLEAASKLPTVTDPAVVELVRRTGKRLAGTLGAQPFEYHFQVVDHSALNAFAVPGGYIWIFSGLVAQVSSVDELASVMGHEIAHVHAHHAVRQQEEMKIWNYAALLGVLLAAVQPVLGAGAIAAAQAAGLKYSREFEEEADYFGLRFMHEAGYEPGAMAAFFKKILAEQRLNPTGVPPYLLTHPLTEHRVAKVETSLAAFAREPRGRPEDGRALQEAQAVIGAMAADPEPVVAKYRRRAEAAPDDGFAQYLLGVVYATVGRLDAAGTTLERARQLSGAGQCLDARLGDVYLRQGRAADAKAILEPYVTAHGDDASARALLGRTLLELGEQEGGIRELEGSISLDPTLAESRRLLGQAYGRAGRSGEAFYQLAKAFEFRGKLSDALKHYIRARDALGPDHPRAQDIAVAVAELADIVGPDAQQPRRPR